MVEAAVFVRSPPVVKSGANLGIGAVFYAWDNSQGIYGKTCAADPVRTVYHEFILTPPSTMAYRIRKVFEVEKSTFRPMAAYAEIPAYRRDFCTPDSQDRRVEVTFEAERLADAATDDAFHGLDAAINDYLDDFSASTCVNRSDPQLPAYKESYTRLVVVDGEPSSALFARLIFDFVDRLLQHRRFIALSGRVRVAEVAVENGDGTAAAYAE